MIYTHAAALLAGIAIGFAGAWKSQDWRYGAIEAKRLSSAIQAEKARDKASYDASVNFEKGKTRVETVFQTITETVETIVDRPVYRNICIDADGLRAIRDASAETATGKSGQPMPASE